MPERQALQHRRQALQHRLLRRGPEYTTLAVVHLYHTLGLSLAPAAAPAPRRLLGLTRDQLVSGKCRSKLRLLCENILGLKQL